MNPTWTKEELILVYDFYLQRGRKGAGPNNPELLALSHYLRSLPWHAEEWRDDSFRNAGAIMNKIHQLRTYEKGRPPPIEMSTHLGARVLTQEYRERPDDLHRLATKIREGVAAQMEVLSDDQPEQSSAVELLIFPEGRAKYVLHRRLERNRRAVVMKLAEVKATTGGLACEVCTFDFEQRYGELGLGFAECHHLLPLSEIGEQETQLSDLAVVCANCHRMLHRRKHKGALPTLEELRRLLENRWSADESEGPD